MSEKVTLTLAQNEIGIACPEGDFNDTTPREDNDGLDIHDYWLANFKSGLGTVSPEALAEFNVVVSDSEYMN